MLPLIVAVGVVQTVIDEPEAIIKHSGGHKKSETEKKEGISCIHNLILIV